MCGPSWASWGPLRGSGDLVPFSCPVCRRYTSKYATEKHLLEHLKEVHPTHAETTSRLEKQRISTYGVDVGKSKPVL